MKLFIIVKNEKMKKNLFILILICVTFISMIGISDLYTKSQLENIINNVVADYYEPTHKKVYLDGNGKYSWVTTDVFEYEYSDEIQPIHLFNFLYFNIHCLCPTDCNEWMAGSGTSEDYKNGWRKLIVKNPDLAYKSLKIYGERLIRQLNSRLEYKAKTNKSSEKINTRRSWEHFTTQKFWIAQTTLIRRYQRLIDKLLKLSDRDLNYYITSNTIYDDGVSYEFQNWLIEKNLLHISNPPIYQKLEKSNKMHRYPGDLLLLTKRIYEDYPETWSPRKFLEEVKKFSNEVLEIIEENY